MTATANEHPDNKLLSWIVSPFYIIFFFAVLVAYHPILVLARMISYRAYQRAMLSMCHSLLRNLSWTAGTKFSFTLNPNLPKDTPIIVISNHQSMCDIPMLVHALYGNDPRFVSKKELGKWLPSISFTLRTTNSALIDRKDRRQSVHEIRRVAKLARQDKAALCLFPEGTRGRDGVIKKFKAAGFLTLLEEIPEAVIVPVAISRSWELMRYQLLPIPYGVHVSVSVLDPMTVDKRDKNKLLDELEELIRKEVHRLDQSTRTRIRCRGTFGPQATS